uniref:Uncharacterized protein n=1 Tax=Candidatus Kentrum sp. DK TaxID=2126562 RepID=A0A450T444_9GAMM|nr:MAG: hypothetical protein BECKDK2373C_GA0170839_10799 [Candidatus Kentron sp. DK]VFJ61363.1 MAG: hypothetical protein BECKDK2373B_GA0170837_110014 [Candidatus Kentron sp. DK]
MKHYLKYAFLGMCCFLGNAVNAGDFQPMSPEQMDATEGSYFFMPPMPGNGPSTAYPGPHG